MVPFQIRLAVCMIYYAIDGLGSMIVYRKQHWYEHIPRIIRALLIYILL